jgi:predicted anti-sigma-YlaC factor YlaD
VNKNETPGNMSCVEFQDQLPELIASGADAAAHPHLRDCETCRALLDDLETIAEAARQLFPSVEPSDDLWEHIESAIKREDKAAPAAG